MSEWVIKCKAGWVCGHDTESGEPLIVDSAVGARKFLEAHAKRKAKMMSAQYGVEFVAVFWASGGAA